MVIRKKNIFFLALFLSSLIMCCIFELDYTLPLTASLSMLLFFAYCGFLPFKGRSLPMLAGFFLTVYCLPFIHLFEYIYNPSVVYSLNMWGLHGNEYLWNLNIVSRVGLIAAIGIGGLSAGFFLSQSKKSISFNAISFGKSLSLPAFTCISLFALFLAWVNAPSETILQSAYTEVQAKICEINFNSAGLLSYIFIALLIIDALADKNAIMRIVKKTIAFSSTAIVVLWFQFMRGDRECMGLIFAVIALSIKMRKRIVPDNVMAMKIFLAICFILVMFIAAQYVGVVRYSLAGTHEISDIFNVDVSFLFGTWSAVLLTPLSVIGDSYCWNVSPKWGKTYWDIFLSLPPGFITKWLGTERPFEPYHSPAWEMTYGLGGTHAVVIPFVNFRSLGVFCVLLLYGYLIGTVETMSRRQTLLRMLLYATSFIIGFAWFWYGEMPAIRGILSFLIVYTIYMVLPKKKSLSQ